MNHKALFVNYFWPPDNAAGVHRPLRFVRHVRQFEWEPIVLCANPRQYSRFDPQLLDKIPSGVETIRVVPKDFWRSFQNWRGKRIAKKIETLSNPNISLGKQSVIKNYGLREIGRKLVAWAEPRYYHPDYYMGWIQPAIRCMLQQPVCKELSAIFSTGGPWSNFEVGYKLSKKLNVPLILDFRDGWTITYNSFEANRPQWARQWDHNRLANYFRQSQSVIFLHEFYAECYLQKYGDALTENKIHIIPNGYESISFDQTEMPSHGKDLTIVYAGTLSHRQFQPLFNVLSRLSKRQPDLNYKFIFIGDTQNEAENEIKKLNLSNWVTFIPTIPFDEASKRMQQAHALLMLGESPLPGYELWIGSKIFQYLAMRRPVLGVLPDNASMRLLKHVGTGPLANIDSDMEIETALLDLHQAWKTSTLDKFLPSHEKISEYSEPRLTKALVRAFEGISPVNPYKKGTVSVPNSLHNKL